MSITIRLKGRTVKDLEEHSTRAFRTGDARLVRRITAILLIIKQQSVAEVAEVLHLGESTLYGWRHAFLLEGCASLRYRRPPGRPAKLTPSQTGALKAWLTAEVTTSTRHASVQRFYFGWLRLRANPLALIGLIILLALVIVADARRTGALLLFGDEASFAQWGSLGYTWALIGQQPVVKTTGKRKAYKVLGMLDFSGRVFIKGQTARFTAAT